MIKKILTLILTVILALSLFGCKPNNSGNNDSGSNTPTEIIDETKFPEVRLVFPTGAPEEKEDEYKQCKITTANCKNSELLSAVSAKVKIRGNSTAKADKKPYRIKFDVKQNMLSLNGGKKYKNWVLLADAYDYSMMRNYFIFNVGNMLSNIHSTDCRHVSLYINNIFQGVYLLAEQNEVNDGRIEVDELSVETSENTGYFVEADSRAVESGECVLFDPTLPSSAIDTVTNDYCIKVVYKSRQNKVEPNLEQLFAIKSDLSTDSAVAYKQLDKIQKYMQAVYDSLFSYQGEKTIRSLINVETAVDMFIVNNIASLRGGKRSDYYYIDFTKPDAKLCFGPPWDYDLDCGNYDMVDDPYSFNGLKNSDYVNYTLNKNAWFVNLVRERWTSLDMATKLRNLLKTVNPDLTSAICNKYKTEFDRNYTLWNVWGTKTFEFVTDECLTWSTHNDAVRHFYNWMNAHIDYADSQWRLY